MPSPNLAIAHVAVSQNQKEVTINDAIDALDRAMTDTLALDLAAGPLVLSASQLQAAKVLRTSMFCAGAMPASPGSDFGWTTNLLYRFSASDGVHKGDAATPTADSDGVAHQSNLCTAEDAVQPAAVR